MNPSIEFILWSSVLCCYLIYIFLWEPLRQLSLRNSLRLIRIRTVLEIRDAGATEQEIKTSDEQLQFFVDSFSSLGLMAYLRFQATRSGVAEEVDRERFWQSLSPRVRKAFAQMTSRLIINLAFGSITGLIIVLFCWVVFGMETCAKLIAEAAPAVARNAALPKRQLVG